MYYITTNERLHNLSVIQVNVYFFNTNTDQCIFFIDLFIINTGQCIFFLILIQVNVYFLLTFFNINTGQCIFFIYLF